MRPLVDLIRFPDSSVQLSACLALTSLVLGPEPGTKAALLYEQALPPLVQLVSHSERELACAAVYALGSVCENEDVRAQVVEMGGISPVITQLNQGDIELKRAGGYFFATLCQQVPPPLVKRSH